MKPRADFVCLSKRCEPPPDQEPDLFEAPVDAVRCPVCGSKRIKRLFNKMAVVGLRTIQPEADWRLTSSSAFQRSKALLQDSFDEKDKLRRAAKEMPTFEVSGSEHEVSTAHGKFIMPSRQEVVQQFGLGGKGQPLTQLEIAREAKQDRLSVPAVLQRINQKPLPTVVVGTPR